MSQDNCEKKNDFVYVVAIGDSGAGKSHHVKLLTGRDDIKVADRKDGNRCTTKAAVYTSSRDSIKKYNYKFIDTQGAQDSKSQESDQEILVKSQKELYELKADRIKILWFVKGSDKGTPVLQKQAKYIQSFVTPQNKNKGSIWDSVFIIIREPGLRIEEKAQGVVEAVQTVKICWIYMFKLVG